MALSRFEGAPPDRPTAGRDLGTQPAALSTPSGLGFFGQDVGLLQSKTGHRAVCQAKGQRAQANGEWANANWRMVAKGSNVDHFLRKWARMAANAAIHMYQCRISLMYFVEMHPV